MPQQTHFTSLINSESEKSVANGCRHVLRLGCFCVRNRLQLCRLLRWSLCGISKPWTASSWDSWTKRSAMRMSFRALDPRSPESHEDAVQGFGYPAQAPSQQSTELQPISYAKSSLGVIRVYNRLPLTFSDSELIKLVKCVCCGIGWTTRKGVAQKMAHVQFCAKKYAFTDDTVKVLIRQEVDSVLPKARRIKGKEIPLILRHTPRSTQDLYGRCVKGAEPKRRARNLEVKTVKSAIETRDVILDRARVILAIPIPRILTFVNFNHKDRRLARSAMALTVRTKAQLPRHWRKAHCSNCVVSCGTALFENGPTFDTAVMGHDKASMPSTQNFAPSKLADLRHTSRNSLFNFERDIDSNLPPNGLSSPFSRGSSSSPRSPGLVRTFFPSVL